MNNGAYGKPENLGPQINTAGNELFPYLAENGALYFSSDGHKGFGLLDIFTVNDLNDPEVKNLGEPVNSSRDDFAFSLAEEPSKGFIASNRPGGKGSDDSYNLNILPPLALSGQVTDSINNKPVANAIVRIMDEKGQQVGFLESDQNGYFRTEIPRDKSIPIQVKHIKYHEKEERINTSNVDHQSELVYNIELSPVNDVEYLAEINKIYFDFDKATIRKDAAEELDKLVELMKYEYPHLVIEIGSHTDRRGSAAYNNRLASRRAQATYDYLVSNGISQERIVTYKGYGEEQLEVACENCSEEQHQLNRRSIFKVIKME